MIAATLWLPILPAARADTPPGRRQPGGVAEYGLAAPVAGGILAKVGGFKLLLAGLLAAKTFIIIGVMAVAGFFRKIFKRRTAANAPAALPGSQDGPKLWKS